MSFYTSLTGLKAAQTDLSVVSNNIANVNSTGFKRSRAMFGDIFTSTPTQSSKMVAGQGTRLVGIQQQFTQGSFETTEKVVDLAVSGQGMFVVKGAPPASETTFTRNGAFSVQPDRSVTDQIGNTLQLLPVDASGNSTGNAASDLTNFVLPTAQAGNPTNLLQNISINERGLVTATYADGTSGYLGRVAMASFDNFEGLRPAGDAHWQATGESGAPTFGSGLDNAFGSVRSGSLERSNVDLTEELVGMLAAQRNFQANAKAIETANTMTQSVMNIRT